MINNNDKLTEEDYLKKHLGNVESQNHRPVDNTLSATQMDNTRSSDLQYLSIDVKEMPCSIFYPSGSIIQVRAAQVKEIQAYSMVDDNNFYDIVEKMNDMLLSCVRIKYMDGTIGSYLDLSDPDRYYLIFLIREMTFQKGSSLTTNAVCKCGESKQIELRRENFKKYSVDPKLMSYFDYDTKAFKFQTVNDTIFYMKPPTIGLQKSFVDYIIDENSKKRKPNLSFLKIIPFMLCDGSSITIDGIKEKLVEFEKMDDISFQFLNSAVNKMVFGIEKLCSNCELCKNTIETDMIFPNGPSAIFVVHDAFEQFIKK